MMNKKSLIGLIGVALTATAYAGNVTIHVQDKTGKPSAKTVVYALQYGEHGPDSSACLVGKTNSRGNVAFKLDDSKEYEIIADKHGVGPTARAQLFNLSRLHLAAGASGTSTVMLGQPFENRGLIAVNTSNATPNTFIIGSIRNKSDGKDVAFAANTTDSRGRAVLVFNNIPPSDANAYEIQLVDPASATSKTQRYSGHLDPVASDRKTTVSIDMTNTQSARLP